MVARKLSNNREAKIENEKMRKSRCKIRERKTVGKVVGDKTNDKVFARETTHVYPGCLEAGPEAGVGTRNNVESGLPLSKK